MLLFYIIIGLMLLFWGAVSLWFEIRLWKHHRRLDAFHLVHTRSCSARQARLRSYPFR